MSDVVPSFAKPELSAMSNERWRSPDCQILFGRLCNKANANIVDILDTG
jgi:hypothetical protein